MEFKRASVRDFERIASFYRYVIEETENISVYARWVYGLHPSDEMIMGYIDTDAMYYIEENGEIICAAAVTMSQGEEYHETKWHIDAEDGEVAVIHIFCADPKRKRQGVGKFAIKEMIALSKSEEKKPSASMRSRQILRRTVCMNPSALSEPTRRHGTPATSDTRIFICTSLYCEKKITGRWLRHLPVLCFG